MEQIIFDSSYLLRTATFWKTYLPFFMGSLFISPLWVVYLFCDRNNGSHPFSEEYCIYFARKLAFIHCLTNSFTGSMLISKKLGVLSKVL